MKHKNYFMAKVKTSTKAKNNLSTNISLNKNDHDDEEEEDDDGDEEELSLDQVQNLDGVSHIEVDGEVFIRSTDLKAMKVSIKGYLGRKVSDEKFKKMLYLAHNFNSELSTPFTHSPDGHLVATVGFWNSVEEHVDYQIDKERKESMKGRIGY